MKLTTVTAVALSALLLLLSVVAGAPVADRTKSKRAVDAPRTSAVLGRVNATRHATAHHDSIKRKRQNQPAGQKPNDVNATRHLAQRYVATTPGWTNLADTIGGIITNTPSSCLALDGANIRNGWDVATSSNNYCCVEHGLYDGTSVCTVGCHSSHRPSGSFVQTSADEGTTCYSRCFDTLGDLALDTSTVAPTGIVNGPAVTIPVTQVGATVGIAVVGIAVGAVATTSTADPVSTYIVQQSAANSKRDGGSSNLFAAYGIDSGFGYGVDTFCTRKGPFSGAAGCTDSCGNPVTEGTYTTVNNYCYNDCYIPQGECQVEETVGDTAYTYSAPLDLFSCWSTIKNDMVFTYASFNGGPFFTSLSTPSYQPVAAQQTCSLKLQNSAAMPLVTQTCDDCLTTCTELNTFESDDIGETVTDCTAYTCVPATPTDCNLLSDLESAPYIAYSTPDCNSCFLNCYYDDNCSYYTYEGGAATWWQTDVCT